jgi:hypothetical protein
MERDPNSDLGALVASPGLGRQEKTVPSVLGG